MRSLLAALALSALCAAPLPAQEAPAAGKPLFDGKTLAGWTDKAGKSLEGNAGWKVLPDGVLHRAAKGGDIFTAEEYGDFELTWEWKLASGANSGVKYRVTKYGKELLGPEYQMLDNDKHADGKLLTHRTASIYDLFPAQNAESRPVGEWNTSKIVAKGGKFEHWLNGKLAASSDTGSESWAAAVAKSKFKSKPDWAKNAAGKIMLQDHGDEAWFRNIVLKAL
jgi:hypothetical protein